MKCKDCGNRSFVHPATCQIIVYFDKNDEIVERDPYPNSVPELDLREESPINRGLVCYNCGGEPEEEVKEVVVEFDIMYDDLTEEAKERLAKETGTDPISHGNLDIVPLAKILVYTKELP